MKYSLLFSLASLESPSWFASAETLVKVLHIYPVPKVLEIWQSAAVEYEKTNPEIQDGKGMANDIFGSIYGWLVSKDSPKEVVEFMKVWLGKSRPPKGRGSGR